MKRQTLLGRGLLGGGLGQPRYRWYAPNWAVDGSGYAYADPPLGAELAANGSFSSDTIWTKGTGWTIAGGVAVASTATGSCTQNVITNAGAGQQGDQIVMSLDIVTRTGGWLRPHIGGTTLWGWQTTGSKLCSGFGSGSNAAGLNVVTNFSGTVDNVSVKRLAGSGLAAVRASEEVRQFGIRLPAWQDNHALQLIGWMDSPASFDPGSFSGNAIIMLLRQNANVTAFSFAIHKLVGSVRTTGITPLTDMPFSAGALLEMRRTGATTFQMWYNGVQYATDITISDASILSNRWFGIHGLTSVQRISEFQINGRKVPFRF